MPDEYDIAIVGAGILGLGHALAAIDRGLRVVVVERAAAIAGSSVRNFGHIGTSMHTGIAHEYAVRTGELWLDLARRAGFWVRESGSLMVARHTDELEVLREAGIGRLLSAEEVRSLAPVAGATGGMLRTGDLQVDPREAAPAIAAYLATLGVEFRWRTSALGAEPGILHTSRGEIAAGAIVVAVNFDVDQLFPAVAEERGIERCSLDMLLADGIGLCLPLLTGTSMLRYSAFSTMPAAEAVRARYAAERPALFAHDVNQMYTERPDGTLIVGDTHRRAITPEPFQDEAAFELLLELSAELFGGPLAVRQRWQGIYASAPDDFLISAPSDAVRVTSVTTGIGMTTGLGLAATVIADLYGAAA